MNILFLTTHFNTGGITSYILTLSRNLVKSGHKVWVVSSGGDCESLLKEVGGIHVTLNIRTKSEVHPKLFFALKPLQNLIRHENINIIHAQTRVTQVLGTWLAKRSGINMITTCHGFFKPRWSRKKFPCWGKAVIAISKPVAQHLSDDLGVPQDKIHLIPHGIDLNIFKVTNEEDRRKSRQAVGIGDVPLIGIIARLSDVKGVDVLIKAMPLILKELPQAILIIAGQGPEESGLKKLTQDLSLTRQVLFKSIINQTQDLLPAFDVFVMPSIMEGLGLSVMEAQACGIPVVASNVGGLVDLIEEGKTGLLVKANDPVALAERILQILRNLPQAQQMAIQARLNIEHHYSINGMLQKTTQIYEQYSGR